MVTEKLTQIIILNVAFSDFATKIVNNFRVEIEEISENIFQSSFACHFTKKKWKKFSPIVSNNSLRFTI